MPKINAAQTSELAMHFLALSQAIGDYRFRNWQKLSRKDNQRLGNFQWSILSCGQEWLALSTTKAWDEAEGSLSKIAALTAKIENVLTGLAKIQRVLDIAAGVVNLGGAIMGRDAKGIGKAIDKLSRALR